jgi:tetratricopeptide (TPR) repeat protein
VKLYNRLGNFHRMIGDSQNAIECFRKALSLESHNSDVLINLARLLQKLDFHEDAIYLTRKSIEFIRADRLPWFQHFTLAEIYKLNGFEDEALVHVKYCLKLKPGYVNAVKLLNELTSKNIIQNLQFPFLFQMFETVHSVLLGSAPSFYLQLFFHLFIIVFLIFFGIIYSLLNILFEDKDPNEEQPAQQQKKITANEGFSLNKYSCSIISNGIKTIKTKNSRFRIKKV